MRVLFLHGLGVKTAGTKPNYLRQEGYEVFEPALPHGDFQEAVRLAQRAFAEQRPEVVVGDCRGGAAALALTSATVPLVLIAPAWKKWGRVQVAKPNSVVLHCRRDRVIPFEHSRELVRRSGLPGSALWVVGHDHFMDDREALEALISAVGQVTRPPALRSPEQTSCRMRGAPDPCVAACHALKTSAFASLRCVTCALREDTVVLDGRVPTYHLKQLAQEIVQRLPDVQQVENRIEVFESARRPAPGGRTDGLTRIPEKAKPYRLPARR